MRSKSIVLIVIAAVCGTVAAASVSQAIKSPSGAGPALLETEKIFVAAKEIDIREAFSAENVRLEEWPRNKVPEGAITNLEEIEGQYSRTRLYEGEVVLRKKLMGKDEIGSHEITIPPGYRVKSVQVNMASAVSNLLMPGSHVDVLTFLKEGAGINKTGAYTILKNVRVFAINDKVDRDIDQDGKTFTAKTVSLLVKPDQVEKLLIASSVGRLELSLRRPDDATDDEEDDDDMTALAELLRGGGDFGVEKQSGGLAPQDTVKSFTAFLEQGAATATPAPPPAEGMPTMLVMTPNGVKQFRWKDPNQLPEEVQDTLTGSPAVLGPPLPSVVATPDPAEGVATGPAPPAAQAEGSEESPN